MKQTLHFMNVLSCNCGIYFSLTIILFQFVFWYSQTSPVQVSGKLIQEIKKQLTSSIRSISFIYEKKKNAIKDSATSELYPLNVYHVTKKLPRIRQTGLHLAVRQSIPLLQMLNFVGLFTRNWSVYFFFYVYLLELFVFFCWKCNLRKTQALYFLHCIPDSKSFKVIIFPKNRAAYSEQKKISSIDAIA